MKSVVVKLLVDVIKLRSVEISPWACARIISSLMRRASFSGVSSAVVPFPTAALLSLSLLKAVSIFLSSTRNKASSMYPTSKVPY